MLDWVYSWLLTEIDAQFLNENQSAIPNKPKSRLNEYLIIGRRR